MSAKNTFATRVLIALVVVIGSIWVISMIVDMLVATYQPPETIGLAFMAVLSTLLGMVAAAQRDGGKSAEQADQNSEPGSNGSD